MPPTQEPRGPLTPTPESGVQQPVASLEKPTPLPAEPAVSLPHIPDHTVSVSPVTQVPEVSHAPVLQTTSETTYPPKRIIGPTGRFVIALTIVAAATALAAGLYFFIVDRLTGPASDALGLAQNAPSEELVDTRDVGQAPGVTAPTDPCAFPPFSTSTEYDADIAVKQVDADQRMADKVVNTDDLLMMQDLELMKAKQRAELSRRLIKEIGSDRLQRISDRYCGSDTGRMAPMMTSDYERAMKEALEADPRVTACVLDTYDGSTTQPIRLTALASKVLPGDFDTGMAIYECAARIQHEPVAAVRLAEFAMYGTNAGTMSGISSRVSERNLMTSYYWASAFRHIAQKYGFSFLENPNEFTDSINSIEEVVRTSGEVSPQSLASTEETVVELLELSPYSTKKTLSTAEAAREERVSIPASTNGTTFYDQQYGIAFPYPPTWKIESYRVDGVRYIDLTERVPGLSVDDTSLARIRVIVDYSDLDLEEIVNRSYRARKNSDWDLTQETSAAKIGTLPATFVRYEYRRKELAGHVGLEYIASGKRGTVYRFILDGDREAIERTTPLFKEMVEKADIRDVMSGAWLPEFRESSEKAETGIFYSPTNQFTVTFDPEYSVDTFSQVNRTTGGGVDVGVALIVTDSKADERKPTLPDMMVISYNAYSPDASTETAAARFGASLKDVDDMKDITVKKGTATLGGVPAVTFSYEFDEPWSKNRIRRTHYVLYKDGFEYQVTVAGSIEAWSTYAPKIDAFLKDIRFEDTFSKRYKDDWFTQSFGPWDRAQP